MILLLVFEYMFMFRHICYFGKSAHPLLMLLVGALIFVVAFVRSRISITHKPVIVHASYIPIIAFAISFISLVCFSWAGIQDAITLRPISISYSDIIPATQLYVSRFVNGDFPYELMDFGWKVVPNYLPMRWMPYIPAYLLDIDFRLWTWIVYLFVVASMIVIWLRRGIHIYRVVGFIILFVIFHYRYLSDGAQDLSMTLEFMNVAAYLLLATAIFSRRWWIIGSAILLCCLSRFSFALWLPFFLLYVWYDRGFWEGFKIGCFVVLGIIILYIIPFESQDWGVFSRGLAYYQHAIIREWMPQNWQSIGDTPIHLDRCTGFAYHMLEWGSGAVEDKVTAYGRLHLLVSIMIMLLVSAVFWWSRAHIVHRSYFVLASLKIYFVVFYAFIAVPYIYLNVLSFVITICLVLFPLRQLITSHPEGAFS